MTREMCIRDSGGSFLHGSFIAVEGFGIDADDFAAHCFERIV